MVKVSFSTGLNRQRKLEKYLLLLFTQWCIWWNREGGRMPLGARWGGAAISPPHTLGCTTHRHATLGTTLHFFRGGQPPKGLLRARESAHPPPKAFQRPKTITSSNASWAAPLGGGAAHTPGTSCILQNVYPLLFLFPEKAIPHHFMERFLSLPSVDSVVFDGLCHGARGKYVTK